MRSLSAAVSALLSSSSFCGGDVLLLVDAQDFVLFLIAHQFFLGSLHFHLQVDELLLQPVGSLPWWIRSGPCGCSST